MAGSNGDSGTSAKRGGGGCTSGCTSGSGAMPLLYPESFRFSGFGGVRGSRNESGLATLGIGSSRMYSIRSVLETFLECCPEASDAGGLERELAALLKPALETESSDKPESDGVCRGFDGRSFAYGGIGGSGGASLRRGPALEPARLLLRTGNVLFDRESVSKILTSVALLVRPFDCEGRRGLAGNPVASSLSWRKGNVCDRLSWVAFGARIVSF
jgi:hypothetical protein